MQPMPSELGTQAGCSAEVNVIRLAGRLSLETVHDFISTMRSPLVLDMSRVSFLDSAGVGALVALFVSRRHTGKKLALAALEAAKYRSIAGFRFDWPVTGVRLGRSRDLPSQNVENRLVCCLRVVCGRACGF
jgi:anti-anti-sigma factor